MNDFMIINPSLRANNLLYISMEKVSRLPFAYPMTMKRMQKDLCEKMAAKISELPYNLPSDLYDYLAQNVVNQCNHMPDMHTTPRTPHEIVTGSKFNFLTDLFMSSVVTSPSIKTPPTLKVYA